MLLNYKGDVLMAFLMERCSLTYAQIDTLMISHSTGDLGTKSRLRDKRKVSKGAFLRTLKQCQKNIEASLYTLILLQYLGLIRTESLANVSTIGLLVSKIKQGSPDCEAVRKLILALDDFGKEFSNRKKRDFLPG